MKYLLAFLLVFCSFNAFAVDGEPTEYFGALWDFIDWIYEALDEIQQAIFDYLLKLSKAIFLLYIKFKISLTGLIYSIVEPMIDALNLTDVISSLFGGLSADVRTAMVQLRLGEGINLLVSAYTTRMIYDKL